MVKALTTFALGIIVVSLMIISFYLAMMYPLVTETIFGLGLVYLVGWATKEYISKWK